MATKYIRYLYPVDPRRPRAGTVVSRLRRAWRQAGLIDQDLDFTPTSVLLKPSGDLAAFCDRAGLFEPALQLAVYGDHGRRFTDPYTTDHGETFSYCPGCDHAIPTRGFVRSRADTETRFQVPISFCPSCGLPFSAATWPRSAEKLAFTAKLVVALRARDYQDARPTLRDCVPSLLAHLELALGEPVEERLVAAPHPAKAPKSRWRQETTPGVHPVDPRCFNPGLMRPSHRRRRPSDRL